MSENCNEEPEAKAMRKMPPKIWGLIPVLIILSIISNARAGTITCTYDNAGRLIKADYGNGKTIEHTYDNAGNLLSRTISTGQVSTYNLNVSINPTGGGTVTGTGINCPGDCTETYTEGTGVGLTANPGAEYQFYGWGGDLSGTANPSTVTMNANKHVVAYFGANTGTTDNDGDGVSSSNEMGPGGTNPSYDGDGNGVPDYQENRVASLPSSTGGGYATIAVPTGQTLTDVRAVGNPSPADAPPGVNFPYGFFEFTINDVTTGGCTTATLYLPRTPLLNTYYKYGPTPGNLSNHWYEFMYNGQTGAEIFHEATWTRIVLHFCDGQRGDDDLTANTRTPDQGGPGQQQAPPIPTITEWGMILMAILIGLSALYFIRRRRSDFTRAQ